MLRGTIKDRSSPPAEGCNRDKIVITSHTWRQDTFNYIKVTALPYKTLTLTQWNNNTKKFIDEKWMKIDRNERHEDR